MTNNFDSRFLILNMISNDLYRDLELFAAINSEEIYGINLCAFPQQIKGRSRWKSERDAKFALIQGMLDDGLIKQLEEKKNYYYAHSPKGCEKFIDFLINEGIIEIVNYESII